MCSCEYGTEPVGCIQCKEYFDWLKNCSSSFSRMALLHEVGSPLQYKDMHICNKPTEIKVYNKVNVEVANEDNVMQHYVPDKVSVYSPFVKDSSVLGTSKLVKTRHLKNQNYVQVGTVQQ